MIIVGDKSYGRLFAVAHWHSFDIIMLGIVLI